MKNSENLAYKFALSAIFLWSTVATAFKIALSYLSPVMLLLLASITSLFILLVVIVFQKKFYLIIKHFSKNSSLILILGILNPFLYYLILFEAYTLLPAQEAQSINYTWALMLSFLAVPFLKQKLRLVDIVAGIICYFGVLIISTRGEPFSMNFSDLRGVSLALLSTIIWALYWIFNTKQKQDPVVSLFSNFLIAVPIIIIYMYFNNEFFIPEYKGVFAAIYVGLFEMGITFLFWLFAMQYTNNTSKIANLIFISPFLSLIFIYFILGEKIYISTLFGLLMIIFGLYIQQKKVKK
ncbi:EamA family transporter [Malaciobacter molluscorum LMG 25693]|uniref:EamA family transporter n=1 Tax=Malaciobacter molluscorum LMG 25693 TaxID=870501 RepID=A0A2G1DGL4_9BACT|nr:DMT family transporter [Malaciobacter molluscorum]PHO17639.1 EamA family transporter [Malaciobacter molluscorum LMG 25693]